MSPGRDPQPPWPAQSDEAPPGTGHRGTRGRASRTADLVAPAFDAHTSTPQPSRLRLPTAVRLCGVRALDRPFVSVFERPVAWFGLFLLRGSWGRIVHTFRTTFAHGRTRQQRHIHLTPPKAGGGHLTAEQPKALGSGTAPQERFSASRIGTLSQGCVLAGYDGRTESRLQTEPPRWGGRWQLSARTHGQGRPGRLSSVLRLLWCEGHGHGPSPGSGAAADRGASRASSWPPGLARRVIARRWEIPNAGFSGSRATSYRITGAGYGHSPGPWALTRTRCAWSLGWRI